METLFQYLIKSGGLIALFFLTYYFLLRKETFFTSNRWFLLTGLFTSMLLPLLFFTKIIWVNPSPVNFDWTKVPQNVNIQNETPEINWYIILGIVYTLGILILIIKFASDFFSLTKVLKGKIIKQQADFKFIDLPENVAPFSYFQYIVYNSSLYSPAELENILEHEKIHSEQNHTIDVLISRIFCILFWYNPFIWWYKKAILQNLEFIADSEASKKISDKKSYQITLLKITTHENCVAITNHFYQSLIKKRIVMLNKNQSKKWNLWKYTTVIPVLVAFVLLFQIKVIAQEKASKEISKTKSNDVNVIQINKNTSDNELKENKENLKSNYNVSAKFSKVKRNHQGELTSIKIDVKTPSGQANTYQFSGNDPIKPFSIIVNKNEDGIVNVDFGSSGNSKLMRNRDRSSDEERELSFSFSNDDDIADIDAPEPPEAPEVIELAEAPEAPEAPSSPREPREMKRRIMIKRGNHQKPTVIINGEEVDDEEVLLNINKDLGDLDNLTINSDDDEISFSSGNDKKRVKVITKEEIKRITKNAMENARIEMKRHKPEMERARREMERARPEIERARREMDLSKPEMEKAREEMQKAKIEMEKAREEMLKAKDEMIKAKAELKTQKA